MSGAVYTITWHHSRRPLPGMALTIQAIRLSGRIFSPATFAAGPVKLGTGMCTFSWTGYRNSYDRDFAVCQPKLCIPPCDGYDGGAGNGGGPFRPVSTHESRCVLQLGANYETRRWPSSSIFTNPPWATTPYAASGYPIRRIEVQPGSDSGRIQLTRPKGGWGEPVKFVGCS